MATKLWNGTNGKFTTSNDWTPTGVPQAGDTAVIQNGTVTFNKLNLNGITLDMESQNLDVPATLSMHNSTIGDAVLGNDAFTFSVANLDINGTVTEDGTLQLGGTNYGSTLSINLVKDQTVFENTGTINSTFSSLFVNGPSLTSVNLGTFDNNGTVNTYGSQTTINTAVTGTGTFNLNLGPSNLNSLLWMNGAVGSGQTIDINPGTHLLLSDTPEFLGSVHFGLAPSPYGPTEMTLTGITSTSSTYDGSVLDVFNGNALVASLKVTTQDMQALAVTSSGGNTYISPYTPTPIVQVADSTPPPILVPHA